MYKISTVSIALFLLILTIITKVSVSNEDNTTTIVNDLNDNTNTIDRFKDNVIFNLVITILISWQLITY